MTQAKKSAYNQDKSNLIGGVCIAVKPIPRKQRKVKELRQAYIISFIVGAMLILAKLALAYLFVLLLVTIVCLIAGDFSALGHYAGSTALYILLCWAIFCAFSIIRIAIQNKVSGSHHKTKHRPDNTAERIDKPNRNTSRKRIAKQKTLERNAAKRKQK